MEKQININNINKENSKLTKEVLMQIIAILVLLLIVFIVDSKLPDTISTKIEKCLEEEGYNIENIQFIRVSRNRMEYPIKYQSSEPIFYNGHYTELWEVRTTKLYLIPRYIISPCYED